MAENPLFRVARLVGGVAMMQGRLGHQVLGQMLIAGTSELAVAGAAVAVAGTARVRNPAAQVVIRTAAPAIAIHALFDQRERVLRYRENALLQHETLRAKNDFALERQNGALRRANAALQNKNDALQNKYDWARAAAAKALKRMRSQEISLKSENDALSGDLAALRKQYHDTRAVAATALRRVRSQKALLKDEQAALTHAHAALKQLNADLRKMCDLASAGHEAYAEALTRLRSENAILERRRAFLEGGKVVLESENAILRHAYAALEKDHADLWNKCNLASDGHDAYAEALKRLRREKAILREDHALCVIDKSILRRRNESLRQELIAVTAKLRALERKPEKPEQ